MKNIKNNACPPKLPICWRGFTFIELMVVVIILAIIMMIALAFFNPFKQTQRAWDTKRTADLSSLKTTLENFYSDRDRFPRATEICFDSPSSPRTDLYGQAACSCNICGRSATSPSLSPYLTNLPCDPQSPQEEYLYDYDCSSTSPSWYRVYAKLSVEDSPASLKLHCSVGCGPAPDYAYNYLVFSSTLPEGLFCSNYTRLWQKKDGSGNCNICKSPTGGDICDYTKSHLYYQATCTKKCNP